MTRAFLAWLLIVAGVVFAAVYFFAAISPMPGATLGLIVTAVGILILAIGKPDGGGLGK
jgi:hypothetical protein